MLGREPACGQGKRAIAPLSVEALSATSPLTPKSCAGTPNASNRLVANCGKNDTRDRISLPPTAGVDTGAALTLSLHRRAPRLRSSTRRNLNLGDPEIPLAGEARKDRIGTDKRAMASVLIQGLSGANAGKPRIVVALVAVLVAALLASFGGASWSS